MEEDRHSSAGELYFEKVSHPRQLFLDTHLTAGQDNSLKVVPMVMGALGAVTVKLEEWLQQILGTLSEMSVQTRAEGPA